MTVIVDQHFLTESLASHDETARTERPQSDAGADNLFGINFRAREWPCR